MSYIKSVLQPGETIRYQGSVSWIVYWPAIVCALLTIVFAVWTWSGSDRATYGFGEIVKVIVAAVALVFTLVFAAHAWFKRWTTEIAITDRRVIYAKGFIQRHSVEVHMDKIESVDVDQSVLGRLLNYGTVTIHGTGTTMDPLPDIDRPIEFRNQVTAQ